jgi:hypothetical protein
MQNGNRDRMEQAGNSTNHLLEKSLSLTQKNVIEMNFFKKIYIL